MQELWGITVSERTSSQTWEANQKLSGKLRVFLPLSEDLFILGIVENDGFKPPLTTLEVVVLSRILKVLLK